MVVPSSSTAGLLSRTNGLAEGDRAGSELNPSPASCLQREDNQDLVYDAGWRGNRKTSHDAVVKKAPEEEFVNLVKQTYRVLLTRGMKGCYVFFEDADIRNFFFSRLGTRAAHVARAE